MTPPEVLRMLLGPEWEAGGLEGAAQERLSAYESRPTMGNPTGQTGSDPCPEKRQNAQGPRLQPSLFIPTRLSTECVVRKCTHSDPRAAVLWLLGLAPPFKDP